MHGDRMRKIREELNLTQEELAEKIGVAVLQINRYEKGKTQPSGEIVKEIALALHVSSDYLLGISSDPTPSEMASSLSTKERAILAAVRQGDKVGAMKAILNDE